MNLINGNSFYQKLSYSLNLFLRRIGLREEVVVFGSAKNEIDSIYIINLDRQKKRWKQFQKEASYQKSKGNKRLIDYSERITAIDGKKSSENELLNENINSNYNINDQYYVDPDPRLLSIIRNNNITIDLTREEIAVALSHLKAWEQLISNNDDFALILEDDVIFEKDFSKLMNLGWKELPIDKSGKPKFDILYVSYKEVDRGLVYQEYSKNLIKPQKGLWWFSGYIISKAGAQNLLSLLPINGPIDLWINHKFKDLNVFALKKSVISQRTDLTSDNSYSILPILSQIGIQSNKTHLELEQKKGINPVFIFGSNKTDSVKLFSLLSFWGYRSCLNQWGELEQNIDQIISKKKPLLFDAYIGFDSLIDHYTELKHLYPDSRFIIFSNPITKPLIVGENINNHQTLKINSLNESHLKKFLNCQHEYSPNESISQNPNIIDKTIIKQSKPVLASSNRIIKHLEHDVTPWIVPINQLESFGLINDKTRQGGLIGTYYPSLEDSFNTINDVHWEILTNTFPSNLAHFTPQNLSTLESGGLKFELKKEKFKNREFTTGSVSTRKEYLYGRFESVMKPAKGNGLITAFFLHRNDPWQEIDFEFLGRDTTKVLLNVYYNPIGTNYNYGNRGTPTVIDLGFDASESYHHYAIEWEPHEIRWYVDNVLIHTRASWNPTPIPDCSMRFFCNLWPSQSEELVGYLDIESLPIYSTFKKIKLNNWSNKKAHNKVYDSMPC